MNDSDETKIRKRISFNEKLALQVMLQQGKIRVLCQLF